MKKLILICVSAILTISSNLVCFASKEFVSTPTVKAEQKILTATNTSATTDIYSNGSIKSSDSSWVTTKFKIPSSSTYFSVDFKNTSGETVSVRVLNSKKIATIVFVVPSGSQVCKSLLGTGDFYVQIDREGGGIAGALLISQSTSKISDENNFRDIYRNKLVNSSDSSWVSFKFNVPSSSSYFNVNFKNTSSEPVLVKIFDLNDVEVLSFDVALQSQNYKSIHKSGDFYVRIDKSGGGIKGELSVAYH